MKRVVGLLVVVVVCSGCGWPRPVLPGRSTTVFTIEQPGCCEEE